MEADIDLFSLAKDCVYKGRIYHVRDNGAVYRQCQNDGVIRKWDEEWTFGKLDPHSGYLLIGQERVHRIVCTAFHGEPVGDRNVVDHIDTNRQNNRPENLRWVTKLENALNNPITRAKIELICGSIEAFLANPSLLRGHESENSNFSWMRRVTPEEALSYYKNWLDWSRKPLEDRKSKGGALGDWIFKHKDNIADSTTASGNEPSWSCQMIDRTEESYFPLAPLSALDGQEVMKKYQESLAPGSVFMVSKKYKAIVSRVAFFPQENKLRVLSRKIGGQRLPWYIFEIWPEDNIIYHKLVGYYGDNRQDDIEKAMSDLSVFHLHDWKYSNHP